MLEFNPYFRPTTKELLQHHVFDEVRTKKEIISAVKIVIDVDENELQSTYEKDKKLTQEQKRKVAIQIKINIIKDFVKLNGASKSCRIGFYYKWNESVLN